MLNFHTNFNARTRRAPFNGGASRSGELRYSDWPETRQNKSERQFVKEIWRVHLTCRTASCSRLAFLQVKLKTRRGVLKQLRNWDPNLELTTTPNFGLGWSQGLDFRRRSLDGNQGRDNWGKVQPRHLETVWVKCHVLATVYLSNDLWFRSLYITSAKLHVRYSSGQKNGKTGRKKIKGVEKQTWIEKLLQKSIRPCQYTNFMSLYDKISSVILSWAFLSLRKSDNTEDLHLRL